METLRIDISGTDLETDAPSVDDLIGQLTDILDLLREIEKAVALPGEEDELEWRVVGAQRSSPLAIEIAAFPKTYGTNIVRRERSVREATSRGLMALCTTSERPVYFNDRALRKAESLFFRVTSRLSETNLTFSGDLPGLNITREVARVAAANIVNATRPVDKPYRELGSVEGFLSAVEKDGWGRPILWLRVRVTDEVVKCVLKGRAIAEIRRYEVGDVIEGTERARVFGTLHYKGIGRLSQIDADDIRILPKSGLPSIEDITDTDFTAGARSEEFLEKVRYGERT